MERISHHTRSHPTLPGATCASFKVERRLRRAKKTSPAGDKHGEDKDAYQQNLKTLHGVATDGKCRPGYFGVTLCRLIPINFKESGSVSMPPLNIAGCQTICQ
jgi:hypothetical protein